MKKIAVLGVGAIGSMIGGYLTKAGEDVTLIEPFWREHLDTLKNTGLKIISPNGEQIIKVKAIFIDELPQQKDKFEVLFVSVKSTDTVKMLKAVKPFITEDAWIISIQNGINEDVIIPIAGKVNVVGCSTLNGGALIGPGVFREGGGGPVGFVIGELDGKTDTPRILELQRILSHVRRTEITPNIMLERWNKLVQVAMSGPVGALGNLTLKGVFADEKAQRVFAKILVEMMQVARAAGYVLNEVIGVKAEDWQKLAKGPVPEVGKVIALEGSHFPDMPVGLTNDINRGRPLEIDYTNGYVVTKGKEVGVPTPVNEMIVRMVKEIAAGTRKAGSANLDEIIAKTS